MKKRPVCALLILALLISIIPCQTAAANVGYCVAASEDKECGVEDNVSVSIRVSDANDGITTYNAYDLSISYDEALLTFVSGRCRDKGAVIEEENGVIRVVGYGADKSFETVIVTLQFRTKAPGTAKVIIDRACVDMGSNAITQDAPPANLTDKETLISIIPSYAVTLEDGLSADSLSAVKGEDYTFRATDPGNYTYAPKVTVGGKEVSVKDNGDGTYTVPGSVITGPMVIQAGRMPKTYSVTISGSDVSGEKTATYNTPYEFKVTKKSGYTYTVTVTVAGKKYTGYTVKSNIYTIPGTDITGDITVAVTSKKTSGTSTSSKQTVSVSFVGSGAQDGSGSKNGRTNTDYTFKLNKQEGYTYDISVQVGGREVTYTYDPDKDTYTVPGKSITGDVTVVITKNVMAELYEYLTLDGAGIFLVVYDREVEVGQVPRFDGQTMYWSERYSAYVWLFSSELEGDSLRGTLEPLITLGEGQAAGTVNYSGNVNLSAKTDINDIQLIHDMYNALYSLGEMQMIKFLNADVNSDKRVDVRDAAAVMGRILAES